MGIVVLILFIIGLICKKKSPKTAKTLIGTALGLNVVNLFISMFSSMVNRASIGAASVFAVFIIIAMTIIMGVTLSKIPDDAPKEQKNRKNTTKGKREKKG